MILGVQPIGSPGIAGAIVFLSLGLFCLSLTIICGVEAWLLFKGFAPITAFVRSDIDHHRIAATMILIGIGMLIGHFWR